MGAWWWWSCVLGLLCIPVDVILGAKTVTQAPLSISLMRINSSAEITCFTSMNGARGFSLYRTFNTKKQIVYLNLYKGEVTKSTVVAEFTKRIRIVPTSPSTKGQGFTLQLSLLGLEDTDVYFCSWSYITLNPAAPPDQSGNGTLIIIRETDPNKQCKSNNLDLIFIVLSVAAFALVSLFCIGTLIVRCNQFSGQFRPAREEIASRPTRQQHLSPQHAEDCPYLITSGNIMYNRHAL